MLSTKKFAITKKIIKKICLLQHLRHGPGVAPSNFSRMPVIASKRAKPAPAFNSWVSCDTCKKWRRVVQEPTVDNWYCSDNLDAEHCACSVPQELSDAALYRELDLAQEAALDARGTAGVNNAAPGRQQGRYGHARRCSRCKACGGASICQHGRQRSRCKESGGSGRCQHGRQRSQCKECGGSSTCQHGRRRSVCKECGGARPGVAEFLE